MVTGCLFDCDQEWALKVDLQPPEEAAAGAWKGQIWIADDFDELPDDVLALFTEGPDNEPSA